MNDNHATELVCRICGKPTIDHEFFTLCSGRQWAHFDCMLDAGRKAIADGELDDVKMVVNWPDRTADIRTGKQLRDGRKR